MTVPQPRTVVVEGPLAYAMRRLAAARGGECGLQIVTLPQLAARLAGGFFYPATPDLIEPAVQGALAAGGLVDLAAVAELPGMTRAATAALRRVWDADVDLQTLPQTVKSARWDDLSLLEQRVRGELPPAAKLPRDLCEAALASLVHAPRVLGTVRIERLTWIAPVWRRLLAALCAKVQVEWIAPECADTSWFSGTVQRLAAANADTAVVSCADPHHEAVEALRWARQLLAVGRARPAEIAIAAASTLAWDEHFLSLTKDTGLRLHFSHGIPALSMRDGQRCAALCDVLLRGLSEARVRRLISLCNGEASPFDRLPNGWIASLPRGATLLTLDDWRRALTRMANDGAPLPEAESFVAALETLARGTDAAVDVGKIFLGGRSRGIWETALRSAPPQALELTLQAVRLPDEVDPGASIAWCPASHLATGPRAWVRLLGLTARAWPRRLTEDSILPHHVVAGLKFEADVQPEADRRNFSAIVAAASGGVVFSRGRRTAQGHRQSPSPLLPRDRAGRDLLRARVPEHAFSEVDRLMARPAEAQSTPLVACANQCWRNWHSGELTPHDGRFGADHPAIKLAITRPQSATSLRLMLRDPLGFVWRYALDWRAPQESERSLTIPADQFGRLVHELLSSAVETLEAGVGFAVASEAEIEAALRRAARHVHQAWPLLGPVPPALLWSSTVEHALRMSVDALKVGETTQADTRSWTEVRFGDPDAVQKEPELPWNPKTPVTIPGTEVRVLGTIDRLDVRTARPAARVTDYKTGQRPNRPEQVVIGGGNELQRALYGLACRQLLPDHVVKARLVYLSPPTLPVELEDLDGALNKIGAFVAAACALLRRGVAVPGPDANLDPDSDTDARESDLRLAAPASPSYLRRKRSTFARAANSISSFWSAK